MSGTIPQPGEPVPGLAGELPMGLQAERAGPRRRFCLVLIKPSHYDDEGYVIQWYRSARPIESRADADKTGA